MAKRGSYKWFSVRGEQRLGRAYGAVVSKSSGASAISKGDAKQKVGTRLELQDQMFESKHRGNFENPAKSLSVSLTVFEKLADDAYAENREPVQHVALYAPDSPLADQDGEVNFIVRLMVDDVTRENLILNYRNGEILG